MNPVFQNYGKGAFLIANPVLPDPNFSRTVVLLCNHGDEGSFGLVVNRAADVSVSEVFSNHEKLLPYGDKVFLGGPVSQAQVFYLCRSASPLPETEVVCANVHLGMNWDALHEILHVLKKPEENIRFYLGYSGWSAGQLANEMSQRSWLTCKASEEFVFCPPESVWERAVRSLGKEFEYLVTAPVNPQWN
jgi:putative transcriptional regulator